MKQYLKHFLRKPYHLIISLLGILSLRNIYFRFASSQEEKQLLIHESSGFPFSTYPTNSFSPQIAKYFQKYSSYEQFEYIGIVENVIIEPIFGWLIYKNRVLIGKSLPFFQDVFYVHKPPFLKHLLTILGFSKKIKTYDTVISLRDISDSNYFHFFDEVITRLTLLKRHNIDISQLPIVVSPRLAKTSFFNDFIRLTKFDEQKIIIQTEYIKAKKAYFVKVFPNTTDYIVDAINPLNSFLNIMNPKQKIFLTRLKQTDVRRIKNEKEVQDLLSKYGFETWDTAELPLEQQIQLFANAKYVVGIHGAGLTNIIFSKNNQISLLEIFPPKNIPPHYFWLAYSLKFKYDALLGNSGNQNIGFTIDCYELESKIKQMLEE